MSEIKSGRDYAFRLPKSGSSEGYYIELNSGEFEGVTYRYGQTKFEEDEEKQEAFVSFQYDILNSNGKENLEENEDFKNHIGNVLMSIIEENVRKNEEFIDKDKE